MHEQPPSDDKPQEPEAPKPPAKRPRSIARIVGAAVVVVLVIAFGKGLGKAIYDEYFRPAPPPSTFHNFFDKFDPPPSR